MLLALFLLFTETLAGTLFEGCDHVVRVRYGETAEITSFNYPKQYPSEQNCRWRVDSPLNTRIFLKCPDLHQPKEDACIQFSVDRTVYPDPVDVQFFCRASPFSVHSLRNRLLIEINNNQHNLPGEPFKCFLTVDYENCDQTINLKIRQRGVQIKSPHYPLKDPPGVSCRWKVTSPHGTRILLACPSTAQPKEDPCGGWFLVALDGKPQFRQPMTYCRHDAFTERSRNNRMMIAYNTSPDSKHGWAYLCYLTVVNVINHEPGFGDKECNCGRRNTARVIGGENAGVNEFPMMAALVYLNDSDIFCGATIISEHSALTAAHCVEHEDVRTLGLLVGEHDHSQASESRILKLDWFYYHQEWNKTGWFENDIAIVHVEKPIPFNVNIGPACLPFSNRHQRLSAEKVIILGWGETANASESNILQKADMVIMNEARCKTWMAKVDYTNKAYCAFKLGKEACYGDSGGPMLWLDPVTLQWKLLGILSSSKCNVYKIANVITRVAYYLDWIEEHITAEDKAGLCRK